MSSISDEEILAYIDGEADEKTIQAVERAIEEDPEARKTADMMRLSKETVKNELREFFEPPEDFINKLRALEAEQERKDDNIVKRYLSWRPLAEVANNNKVKLLVAACCAFVFVVTGDLTQFTHSPWQGQVFINPQTQTSTPKTRSTISNERATKEIKFQSIKDKSINLSIRIYPAQNEQKRIPATTNKPFIVYSDWVKSLAGLFGKTMDDSVYVDVGQSIKIVINTASDGILNLRLFQDNDTDLTIFDNLQVTAPQKIISQRLTTQPPASKGHFHLHFEPKKGEPLQLMIPFILKTNDRE